MTLSAFRALPETDRLLALALQAHDDSHCAGCGQRLDECMDPDLADEWTTMHPQRCGGCTALARAADHAKDAEHPQALRYVIGLREGWESRKASLAGERAEATSGA